MREKRGWARKILLESQVWSPYSVIPCSPGVEESLKKSGLRAFWDADRKVRECPRPDALPSGLRLSEMAR